LSEVFTSPTTTCWPNFHPIDPPSVPTRHPVHLSPVSTFIQGAKDGQFGYVVSSIANHWGVIVGGANRFLYHLVFEEQANAASDSNPDSLTGRTMAVKFRCTDWDSSRESPLSTKYVGDTRFSHEEILGIGRHLKIVYIYQ